MLSRILGLQQGTILQTPNDHKHHHYCPCKTNPRCGWRKPAAPASFWDTSKYFLFRRVCRASFKIVHQDSSATTSHNCLPISTINCKIRQKYLQIWIFNFGFWHKKGSCHCTLCWTVMSWLIWAPIMAKVDKMCQKHFPDHRPIFRELLLPPPWPSYQCYFFNSKFFKTCSRSDRDKRVGLTRDNWLESDSRNVEWAIHNIYATALSIHGRKTFFKSAKTSFIQLCVCESFSWEIGNANEYVRCVLIIFHLQVSSIVRLNSF